MTTKGFAEKESNMETPNDVINSEKPLKSKPMSSNEIDNGVKKTTI